MPRRTPPDRFSKLLDAAAATFVQHGYQRAQMDDVAERLGVSKGTVYRSVDSKDALFAAVVAWADAPESVPDEGLNRSGAISSVAVRLSRELADAVAGLELAAVVASRKRLRAAAAFPEEVERVTKGLYGLLHGRRTAIMVLDRCAAEIPDVAEVWFGAGRYGLVDLWQDYLTLRAAHVAPGVDPAVLARTIVEVVTTWAVKMPWDPAPRPYPADNSDACSVMVRRLVSEVSR